MARRGEGLTDTYNRFHNADEHAADIQELRELHAQMDRAVAESYGWADLNMAHGFHETKQGVRYTICESARLEALARLLKLNHERHAEGVVLSVNESKRKASKQHDKDGGLYLFGSRDSE